MAVIVDARAPQHGDIMQMVVTTPREDVKTAMARRRPLSSFFPLVEVLQPWHQFDMTSYNVDDTILLKFGRWSRTDH